MVNETIERWFVRKWPDANIGIATGAGSNLFVLDVDGRKGEAALAGLVAKFGQLPDTLSAVTGRGRHFYFRHPDVAIKNSAGTLGAGLDIRGEGGYVVAPPSQHYSGGVYRWEDPDTPVADAPKWLIGVVTCELEAIQTGHQVSQIFERNGTLIPEGTRNETLFKEACALRGGGADLDQIEEIIMQINQEQCVPPLDAKEVKQIATSAAEYQPDANTSSPARKTDPLWWLKFDVNEWCTDPRILSMTDYQRGWYITLLATCWKSRGFLPNDPGKLARIAGAEDRDKFKNELADVLWAFEPCEHGEQIVHTRLNAEWNEKANEVERNRLAGKASATSRAKQSQKAAA